MDRDGEIRPKRNPGASKIHNEITPCGTLKDRSSHQETTMTAATIIADRTADQSATAAIRARQGVGMGDNPPVIADYLEAGSFGPVVILVHSSVSGARQWRRLMDDLKGDFRVRAVNFVNRRRKVGHDRRPKLVHASG